MRRRLATAISLAVLVVAAMASPALAGPGTTVSVSPSVLGTDATVTVTVNKKPAAITSCLWSLDSISWASCGTKSAFGSKATRYTLELDGLAAGDYTLTVSVTLTDGGGGTGTGAFSISAACSPDVSPPSAPSNLHTTATSQTSISIAWDPSVDDCAVGGYRVSVNGSLVSTTSGTTSTLGGLTPGSQYSIAVRAFDLVLNQSAPAAIVASTDEP